MTAAILLRLLRGPATTRELAEEVRRRAKRRVWPEDLHPYLRYYSAKGWVAKDGATWSLTAGGERCVRKYERWLRELLGDGRG